MQSPNKLHKSIFSTRILLLVFLIAFLNPITAKSPDSSHRGRKISDLGIGLDLPFYDSDKLAAAGIRRMEYVWPESYYTCYYLSQKGRITHFESLDKRRKKDIVYHQGHISYDSQGRTVLLSSFGKYSASRDSMAYDSLGRILFISKEYAWGSLRKRRKQKSYHSSSQIIQKLDSSLERYTLEDTLSQIQYFLDSENHVQQVLRYGEHKDSLATLKLGNNQLRKEHWTWLPRAKRWLLGTEEDLIGEKVSEIRVYHWDYIDHSKKGRKLVSQQKYEYRPDGSLSKVTYPLKNMEDRLYYNEQGLLEKETQISEQGELERYSIQYFKELKPNRERSYWKELKPLF